MAIAASGWLQNAGEGYSAGVEFVMVDMTNPATVSEPSQITLGAAGLMLGRPMRTSGFPDSVRFTPYGYLRNTTQQPLIVNLKANLASGDMAMTANSGSGGAPTSQTVRIMLGPGEVRQVPLPELARLLVRRANMDPESFEGAQLNWSAAYDGLAGDLLMATGSTDQTGNYVFEVMPEALSPSVGLQLPYWNTAHGNNTMYSLWNPGTTTQNVVLTLYSADGTHDYAIPISLAPGASASVDVGTLRMEGVPDAGGQFIPPDVEDGSAMLTPAAAATPGADGKIKQPASGPAEMEVVVNAGIFNPVTATCCSQCMYCCFYTCPIVSSFLVALGNNGSSEMTVEDCCGILNDVSASASWGSGNPSVLSSQGQGSFHAAAVGVSFVSASANLESASASGPYCPVGCKKGPIGGGSDCTATQCGDPASPTSGDRGALMNEYATYGVTNVSPTCSDFTSSTGSAADGGLLTPKEDYSWALIGLPISHQHAAGVGYDVWMADYVADTGDHASHAVDSGYRNPAHNHAIGGATQSAHMAGVAVDVNNNSQTLNEHNEFVAAAGQAGAFYIEPTTGHCGLACTHVDWRTTTYSYSGGFPH